MIILQLNLCKRAIPDHRASNSYWQPTLATACSPLDAGLTDVKIGRHYRAVADFRGCRRPPLSKN